MIAAEVGGNSHRVDVAEETGIMCSSEDHLGFEQNTDAFLTNISEKCILVVGS